MPIPEVTFDIQDNALGALPANVAGASVKLGVCSKGTANTLQGYSDINTLKKDLGQGPLVEAIATVLNEAGGPVYACPVTISAAGTVGAVTHEGPGTGTVTPTAAPDREIIAKVSTAGTLGTAAVQFNVDGQGFGAPITSVGPGPWDVQVPGSPLVTLRFPAGTYVLNETYTFATTGAMTQSGAGPVVTRPSTSAVDAYDVRIEIATGGGLGAGAFVYSLDGGNNWSPVIAIPGGGGIYAIPTAGLILTFSGTFTEGDTYAFTTTAAGFSNSNVTAALDAILALSTEWGFIHVVGTHATAALAAGLATAVGTKMTAAETAFRFAFGIIECPTVGQTDQNLIDEFDDFAHSRIMVCAGDAGVVSPLTGRTVRRNCAWVVSARLAAIKASEDPAWVGRGPLTGVQSLYRNEAVTTMLDEQRFTTLRTHVGRAGYYVTNGRMMATGGSDFSFVTNRRVMDRACQIARAAELPFLNQDVRVDKDGHVNEKDAQQFEADVNAQLRAGLLGPQLASDTRVVLSRSANLLSGEAAPVTIRVVPKAYFKHIETDIGFMNPALAA